MQRVNNIFQKVDKKITLSIGIFFLTLIIFLGLMKVLLNVLYPGNELPVLIKESIRDTFGKAVKFDSYYFRYNGDIVLVNFYLSNTSDFNDNLNLVECNNIIISTDILSLFSKDIRISGVYIYDPELNIVKNYGKKYYDIITDNFTSGINSERFNSLASNGFFITIYNGKGSYREVFRNGKTVIEFNDLDASIKYRNKKISYSADGDVVKKEKSLLDTCSVKIKGELDTTNMRSESRVCVDDLDLVQLEEFFRDHNLTDYTLKGDLSLDIKISHADNFTRLNGEAGIDKLECTRKGNENSSYLIKHDDISSEFNIYFSDDSSLIRLESFLLEDGIFSIEGVMEYERDIRLFADIRSNRIDLEDLSEYYIPFPGAGYDGYLQFNGRLLYRIDQNMPEDIAMELNLEKFNLRKNSDADVVSMLVKNCTAGFSINKNKMDISANLITGKSDFRLSAETEIRNWYPFTSNTTLRSSSENLELDLLRNGIVSCIKIIYDEAFIDMFQNFDEQRNFLKEPEGIFICNNNINFDFTARSLLIAGNSRLNDFNINLALANGTLKTNNFKLYGYSGTYSLDLYAAFKQEYPFIKITGSVTGFDLGAVSADSGLPYSFSGIFACDYKFETNAYRIGQVIENGNASIALAVTSGSFNNSYLMKNIHSYLAANSYTCDTFDNIGFDAMSFEFVQSGSEFYIKKFSVTGPVLNLSGYGKYISEDEGLKLPVNLECKNGADYVRVPMMIFGELLAPCIKVNDKKSSGEVCF